MGRSNECHKNSFFEYLKIKDFVDTRKYEHKLISPQKKLSWFDFASILDVFHLAERIMLCASW